MMSLFSTLRRRQHRLGRLIVAGFAVVWLNMAVQPCLMAAAPLVGDMGHDCPHCPEPASHCDDASASRCTYVDGFDYDGRQSAGQSSADSADAMSWHPVTAAYAVTLAAPTGRFEQPPPGPPPRAVPIHVEHCVQLK